MSGSPKSILIVDDSATVRAALRSFIESIGGFHVCGEAFDGAEAVVKAGELAPKLVIMDLSMPNMNGLQAAWAIRQAAPGVKIVLFTLYPHLVRKLMAKTVGIDIVVSKAEGTEALTKALQPFLKESSPAN